MDLVSASVEDSNSFIIHVAVADEAHSRAWKLASMKTAGLFYTVGGEEIINEKVRNMLKTYGSFWVTDATEWPTFQRISNVDVRQYIWICSKSTIQPSLNFSECIEECPIECISAFSRFACSQFRVLLINESVVDQRHKWILLVRFKWKFGFVIRTFECFPL